MSDLIRRFAKIRAEECIEDWHHEDRHELNDSWGTEFTDDEIDQIVDLAGKAVVTIPGDGEDS